MTKPTLPRLRTSALLIAIVVVAFLISSRPIPGRRLSKTTNPSSKPEQLKSSDPARGTQIPKPIPKTPTSSIPTTCTSDHLYNRKGQPCREDLTQLVKDQNIRIINANGARYMNCVPCKNGSSYHNSLFYRILNSHKYSSLGLIHHNETFKDSILLEKRTAAQIASYFADDTLPKYAVVRNPLIRTLSGYINSIEKKEQNEERGFSDAEAFQLWIKKNYPLDFDPYVAREKKIIKHAKEQLDYCGYHYADFWKKWKIFKFEQPDAYVDFLYDQVPHKFLSDGWGSQFNFSFRDFVLGPRERTHNTTIKFAYYVGSMEMFDYLATVLKAETDFFNYRKDVAELRVETQQILAAE